MRRLTLLAVAGVLGLYACSDQNTESPTEPSVAPPSEDFGSTCTHGRYPLASVTALAANDALWKNKPARVEALLRLGTIALLWDTCNDQLARKAALSMVLWIDKNTAKNVNQTKVNELKAAILAGFGGASATGGDDFATGVFDPTQTAPTIITTPSGKAGIKLVKGAFNEPTLITVRRLPDAFQLVDVTEGYVQEPPYWDYDATNSSTDNTVETHEVGLVDGVPAATIAFCFREDGEGEQTYPEPGASIGHNPVGGGFEIVDEVEDIPDDLEAALDCFQDPVVGSADGLRGFSRYLASLAMNALLPEPLHAAAVGTRGPIAGTPISLSPFGIVIPESEGGLSLEFHSERGLVFEPGGESLVVGSRDVLRWWETGVFDGFPFGVWVYPALRVLDASGSPQPDVPIGVSLVPVNGSAGTLGGTPTASTSEVTGFSSMVAFFDDLTIDLPGIYRLEFTTLGAEPLQSGEFSVGLGPVSIPESFGSADWSYKQVSSFDAIPQSWWTITPTPASGWTVGTAPFGTSGSCELPQPVTPWTQATTMLLRRDILVNSNVASITLEIRVDGDVFAAVNGWGVDGGGVFGVTCGGPLAQFTILASQTGVATAEAPLLPGQENKIFIRGVDDEIADGSQSYLDARITVNALPPIN
jgi:hypothetical protein